MGHRALQPLLLALLVHVISDLGRTFRKTVRKHSAAKNEAFKTYSFDKQYPVNL